MPIMNINLIQLKGIAKELKGIRLAVERLADCWEAELEIAGHRPLKVDTSGPEPTVAFVDEESDWIRENVDRYRREDERLVQREDHRETSGKD
jgi:hypothetical protein